MKKRSAKFVLVLVLIIVLSILIPTLISVIQITEYAEVDEKQAADCIIILGAGTSEGNVSPVFRERLNHGVSLYKQGFSDKIILTGGVGKGNSVSDSRVARDYVVSCGVSADDVFIEEKSTITEQNLINAKDIMDKKGFSDAIIVSDPLHMKRATALAYDFGMDVYSSPTPTSMYRGLGEKLKFLAREVFFYIGYYAVKPFR